MFVLDSKKNGNAGKQGLIILVRTLLLRRESVPFLLTFGVLMARGGLVAGQPSKPMSLPKQVILDWNKAGAHVGWMGRDRFGILGFQSEPQGLDNAIPAFHFRSWNSNDVKLPDPGVGFAVSLRSTEVSDKGLKSMTHLESLRAVDLRKTKVTDAGLKEIAKLRGIQAIDLSSTRISDKGLKALSKIDSLRLLDLAETEVTDEGIKELASFICFGGSTAVEYEGHRQDSTLSR